MAFHLFKGAGEKKRDAVITAVFRQGVGELIDCTLPILLLVTDEADFDGGIVKEKGREGP